jgi:hypothetical protein
MNYQPGRIEFSFPKMMISMKLIKSALLLSLITAIFLPHVYSIFRKVKVNSRMHLLLRIQKEASKLP